MLAITQVVWRHLLVGARQGRQRWPSITAVADELGLGVSTVHKALTRPVEIEAVRVTRQAGLVVLDPYRLLLMFATHRRLQRDIITRHRVAVPTAQLESLAVEDPRMILGGFGAAVAHLGQNPIASYTTAIVYGDPAFADELPSSAADDASQLVIVAPDRWLERYGPATPFAQAFADLFCLPGWQAARFIEELDPWRIATNHDRELIA